MNLIVSGPMDGGHFSYTVDMILATVILLKFYTVGRLYEHLSMWTEPKAKKVSTSKGISTTYKYAFKCDINSYNIRVISFTLLVLSIFFSAAMINYEKTYYNPRLTAAWHDFFSSYINVVYLQVISLSTVGYGTSHNAFPASIPG